MGHQLARAAVAAGLTLLVACGGGVDDAQPSVLDVAREQVAVSADGAGDTVEGELPPPDPSLFVGDHRIVNLWADADGDGEIVDVWGRRTFTNGPVLLVTGIEPGAVTDYFAAPPGYDVVVVGAGAGPDGTELAGLVDVEPGEQVTTILVSGPDGAVATTNVWERDPSGVFGAPAPPVNGRGLVVFVAPASPMLDAAIGAAHDGLLVGDGSDECIRQRAEADGYAARVLDGSEQVEIEVRPGANEFTLHGSADGCDTTPIAEVSVDVRADEISLVVVHSVDGETVEALVVPVAP